MSETFRDANLLAQVALDGQQASFVVLVDGAPNAGKSTLARSLALKWNAAHLDFDRYVPHGYRDYLSEIDADKLGSDIAKAQGRVVLSGVLGLSVLTKLGRVADVHIYVKRMRGQRWLDRSELEGSQLEEIAVACGRAPTDYPLTFAVVRYHRERRPQDCARFLFEREE